MDKDRWQAWVNIGGIVTTLSSGGALMWLGAIASNPQAHLELWQPLFIGSLGALVIGAMILSSCMYGIPLPRLRRRVQPVIPLPAPGTVTQNFLGPTTVIVMAQASARIDEGPSDEPELNS
jgi:hypothetical protein